MNKLIEKLKNPVWYSLNETHQSFLIEYEGVRFYRPEICTFGAFFDPSKTAKALNAYSKISDRFFLVSENLIPIIDSKKVHLEKKINGCQMVLENLVEVKNSEKIVLLTQEYSKEIYDLIWLVMP